MKKNMINCDVIQDLLPLYEDGCCSERSGELVEEHLKYCENCRMKYSQYENQLPEMNEPELFEADQIRRGMKKINQWKIRGIIAFCLSLILILGVVPTWNYINGEGITYNNLKIVQMAYSFEKALANRDYEKAYGYLDIEGKYNDLLSTSMTPDNISVIKGIHEIEDNGFEWYNKIAKEKFLENMDTLDDMQEMVESYKGFRIEKQSNGWTVFFDAVRTTSDQNLIMQLDMDSDGIRNVSISVDYVPIDSVTGEKTMNEEAEQKELMLSRYYRFPTINETVMEILYNETEFDWTKLFEY